MNARGLSVVSVLALVVACAAPEPPKVTPKEVTVIGVTNTGLDLSAKLAIENPNGFELSAQSVKAKVVVGGTVDLGVVNVEKPFALPAKTTTNLDVPLTLTWESAAPLIPLAQKPIVPFTVDGTVQFGGRVSIALPFHLEGTIRRDQILKSVVGRLPLPM